MHGRDEGGETKMMSGPSMKRGQSDSYDSCCKVICYCWVGGCESKCARMLQSAAPDDS